MRRWRRATVWVINGKHRKCVWTGRYIKKLHLKSHQSHNWSRRGFIFRNFITQVHVSNCFSPSSLPFAPSAPWNEQPFHCFSSLALPAPYDILCRCLPVPHTPAALQAATVVKTNRCAQHSSAVLPSPGRRSRCGCYCVKRSSSWLCGRVEGVQGGLTRLWAP